MGTATGTDKAENMLNLGLGTMLAGGIMDAAGAWTESEAQNAYARAKAQAYENQAALELLGAQRQNDYTSDTAARQLKQIKEQAAQTRGAQKAALGASGGLGGGSEAELLLDSLSAQAQDEELLRLNAARENYERMLSAQLSAIDLRAQATTARVGGKSAKRAGAVNAFSSVLGTASQMGAWQMQFGNLKGGEK